MINNLEYKVIGLIVNNDELFNGFDYKLLFNPDCLRLYHILKNVKEKCGKYNKELIISHIEENNNFDIEKFYEIYDCHSIYDAADYDNYLIELTTKKMKHELQMYCGSLRNNAGNYREIKQEVINLVNNTKDIQLSKIENNNDLCMQSLEELRDDYKLKKIYSAVNFIEKSKNGYDTDDYIILSGTESAGKTSFMLHLIACQIKKGIKIVLFSCEVYRKKIFQMMACIIAEIDINLLDQKMLIESEKQKYIDAVALLYESNLIIIEKENRIDRIVEMMRVYKKEKNIDMFYIDHLHQLEVKADRMLSEYEELKIISKTIKKTTTELNTPIFCIAIMNKIGKQDSEPQLWHVSGNGKIGYDCDVAILINTEEMLEDYRLLKFFVRKNRYGKTGSYKMKFICNIRRFLNEY